MSAKYICINDFKDEKPINVFHKELSPKAPNNADAFQNRHILFRKRFSVENTKNAVIKITADDYFKLYVNGEYVLQGPPPGYPQKGYYYLQKDITEFLRKGENVLAVHTYYQGLVNRVWVSADMREMLWCELSVDGKVCVSSDTDWRVHDHSGYGKYRVMGYDTQFTEIYDSRSEEIGFERADFDDSAWENASEYKNADYKLLKSPIEPLTLYPQIPDKIEHRLGNVIFVDFKQEAVGYLSVTAKGARGSTVLIRYGEELNADGSVRYDMRCNCIYEDKWILSGSDDLFSAFDYKALRYAEIVFPEGCQVSDIRRIVRHYPFKEVVTPELTDENTRAIWELCKNTVKYGVQEGYLDCPTREKGQYLGDLAVSGRAHTILTGDASLLKKSLIDFCHSTFICEGMMAVSCASLNQEIADYSLLFAALCVWVYDFDGDIEFLRRIEPYANGIYRYFQKYENADGLLDGVTEKWNLVDWPENLRDGYDFPLTKPIGMGVHNTVNAFYIGMLSALKEIYLILGENIELDIEGKKKAFRRCFFNESSALFCDSVQKTHSSVHSNVLPLLFGIVADNEAERDGIAEFIHQKGLTSMGTYMSYFALAALMKNGYADIANELLTSKGAWLNMLSEGATTTFEAWGKDQKWNTSLFHPWSVAPLIVLSKARIY